MGRAGTGQIRQCPGRHPPKIGFNPDCLLDLGLIYNRFDRQFLGGVGFGPTIWLPQRNGFYLGLVPVVYYLSILLKNYFVWNQASFYVALLSMVIIFICYPLLYLLSLGKGKRHV